MSSIKPDITVSSSSTPGFGYTGILTTSIAVSGLVLNGGRHFYGYIGVPLNALSIGFYKVTGSSIFTSDDKTEVGNGYSGVDNALGMTTYIFGSQSGTTYTVDILINNYSGSTQTVPTQTVNIELYTFISPFN